jgi:hypothetical protein
MLAAMQDGVPNAGMVLALDDALQLTWVVDQQGLGDIVVGSGLSRTEEEGTVTLAAAGDSASGIHVTDYGIGIAPAGVTREMLATTVDSVPAAGSVLALDATLQLTWAVDQQGSGDIPIGQGLKWEEVDGVETLYAAEDINNGINVTESGIGISEGGVSMGKIDATGDKERGHVLSIGDSSNMVWTDVDTVPVNGDGELIAETIDETLVPGVETFELDDNNFFTLRLAWGFPKNGELVVIDGFKGGGKILVSYIRITMGQQGRDDTTKSCSPGDELEKFDNVILKCSKAEDSEQTTEPVHPNLILEVSRQDSVRYRLTH